MVVYESIEGEIIPNYYKVKKHLVLLHDSDSEDNIKAVFDFSMDNRKQQKIIIVWFKLYSNRHF